MTSEKTQGLLKGLAPRLAATLTLALAPIGIIAIFQSAQIEEGASGIREASLLALTAEAAAAESRVISMAQGAVSALIADTQTSGSDAENCSDAYGQFVASNSLFSVAVYIDATGTVKCGSAGVGRDLSSTLTYELMTKDPRPRVVVSESAVLSKTSVIIVTAPDFDETGFVGYTAVSVPHNRIALESSEIKAPIDHPLELITFNADGLILSSETGIQDAESKLPKNRPLLSLIGKGQFSFTGLANDGASRIFAVTPIIPGEVYAIGSWPLEALEVATTPSWVFPLVMLLTGLIVAWYATNRFVIRHIRALQRDMGIFAEVRRIPDLHRRQVLPSEIRSIYETWHDIAHQLLMDEAELEGALKEKNVLLKEVHHRVKNNLQLVASIVNLKLRRAKNPDAQNVLREVQLRVMSIASVHRALYLTSQEGLVRADELLRSVVDYTLDAVAIPTAGLSIDRSFDKVLLFPDQAVPLSLFVSEAVTNALKYMGRRADGSAVLSVDLVAEQDDAARLTVSNSLGTRLMPDAEVRGSGLGNSLIQAFAQQLRGTCTIDQTDEAYVVSVSFQSLPFDQEVRSNEIVEDEPAEAAPQATGEATP